MNIKLTKIEMKILAALKGGKNNARGISALVFGKKEENIKQGEVRDVRNGLRKIVNRRLVDNAERGMYALTATGKKAAKSGAGVVEAISKTTKSKSKKTTKSKSKAKAKTKTAKKAKTAIEVVDKTTSKPAAKKANGNGNGTARKGMPTFKRRNLSKPYTRQGQ